MRLSRAWVALMLSGVVFVCGVLLLGHSGLYLRSRVLPVRVIAHEWWWEFDYPSLGIKTSDVLHLPSDRLVRLELQSADVIHSFWIDGMGKALDLPPGKTELLDLKVKSPGELHGNCDAGCGCGTVCMRFRVLASTSRDFDLWAARQSAHPAPLKIARNDTAPACALDKSVDRQNPVPARPGSSVAITSVPNGDQSTIK